MPETDYGDSDTSVPDQAASDLGSETLLAPQGWETPLSPLISRDRSRSPPVLEEGSWLSACGGLLTAQTRPADKDALAKWGADVVVVLRDAKDKSRIVNEAESVGMLSHSRTFKLPRRNVASPTTMQPLTAAVCYAHLWLRKGYRVAVVSHEGLRRTGAVVYALLRWEPVFEAACSPYGSSAAVAKTPRWQVLRGIEEMNGEVYDALTQKEHLSNNPAVFSDRLECHITSPEFQRALGL